MEIIDALTFIGNTAYWKFSAEELIKRMDANNISRSITTPAPPGPDYREANMAVREAVKRYPDRLLGFYRVNPHYGDRILRDAETAIAEWGFKGMMLDPTNEAFGVTLRTVEGTMELARRLKIPVYYHTGDSIFCPPEQVGDIARLYPRVPIMMHASTAATREARRYDNIVLTTGPLGGPGLLDRAPDTIDLNRLVFSSLVPIGYPELELRCFEHSFLAKSDKQRILSQNIKGLLQI